MVACAPVVCCFDCPSNWFVVDVENCYCCDWVKCSVFQCVLEYGLCDACYCEQLGFQHFAKHWQDCFCCVAAPYVLCAVHIKIVNLCILEDNRFHQLISLIFSHRKGSLLAPFVWLTGVVTGPP